MYELIIKEQFDKSFSKIKAPGAGCGAAGRGRFDRRCVRARVFQEGLYAIIRVLHRQIRFISTHQKDKGVSFLLLVFQTFLSLHIQFTSHILQRS